MFTSASFGNWLKQQRKSMDWTQAQLAEKVGCSVALIRKFESDERRPSKQIVLILADVLSIPPDEREKFLAYARGKQTYPARPQSNLLADHTPFIGRKSELEMLRTRLASPECRLLVLTGPGGIGKTRLAIQTGREVAHLFADGVFYVSLVGVDSAEYLVSSIVSALLLPFHNLAESKTQLLHYLRGHKLLLILDNYEQLLPRTDLITEIIETAPDVKILVTSRERLNVPEEWGFPVRGLSYPKHAADNDAESDALRLFTQRAAQVDTHVILAESDQPFIGRIIELAQGNPLAIELAAAWTRLLSCQEIAEAIQTNWDFVSDEPRNVPERHQSMRAVFEHSWKRLSPERQMAFMKLSVFRGGFTQDAARGVADVNLSMLGDLQNRSFLMRTATGRYDIHDLLRFYGESKLTELPDELSATHEKFLAYYGTLLNNLRDHVWDSRRKQAVAQIKTEIDNIRHAWNLATARSNWEFFNRSAESMWHYYNDTNLFEEGSRLFLQAAEQLSPQARDPTHALALALLFHGPGQFSYRLGRLADAKMLQDRSLAWLSQTGFQDIHTEMLLKGSAFQIAYALNDYQEAQIYAEELLALGQQSGDGIALAAGHLFCGMIARTTGNLGTAETHLNEVAQFSEASGSQWMLAYVLIELGQVKLAARKPDEAKTHFKTCADIFLKHDDVANAARARILLGKTYREMRQKAEAAASFFAALRESHAVHALPVTSDALIEIALLLVDEAELAVAFEILAAVRLHPATKGDMRTRIDRILANMKMPSPSISGDEQEVTSDLQNAIATALNCETLLRDD